LGQIDPTKDQEDYYRTATTLVEFLSETENHQQEAKVLNGIVSTKIPETQPIKLQWMQLYIRRNLAYSGHADDAQKYLRALTAGDARLVLIPAQQSAALLLSEIELDRGNGGQAAAWMRRAVIGALVNTGNGSEEIVDVLTAYARYLARTRRLSEAYNLFLRLGPLYEAYYTTPGST
jgi:hypothetical protein